MGSRRGYETGKLYKVSTFSIRTLLVLPIHVALGFPKLLPFKSALGICSSLKSQGSWRR